MEDQKHVDLLRSGVASWNAWRDAHPDVNPNLIGADLAGVDLRGANLARAMLARADLGGAQLAKATMRSAHLLVANLRGADLEGADLTHADLFGCVLEGTNLRAANLVGARGSRAQLSGCDLAGKDLEGASFSEANLTGADLRGTNLLEANLSGADLRGAKLAGARLKRTDLSGANLSEVDLSQAEFGSHTSFAGADLHAAKFWEANLLGVNFAGADLRGAYFGGALSWEVNFAGANLSGAFMDKAHLEGADLRGAQLVGANLAGSYLRGADLSGADLSGANLEGAQLVKVNINGTRLTACRVYGVSAWDVRGAPKDQTGLIIMPESDVSITVDDLELAQFLYLLLDRAKVRNAIDSLTCKTVLILGRFTSERKAILDALAGEVRRNNLLPIIFDFDRPASRGVTETIKTLAGLSFFVIADITNPKSSPLELQATVPDYQVPFVAIIQQGETPFSMFTDLANQYDWVLQPVFAYSSEAELLRNFKVAVLDRVWKKHRELAERKARAIQSVSIEEFCKTGGSGGEPDDGAQPPPGKPG